MMTNLPIFPEHDSGDDNTPFPLFIAKRFDFPLAYHERGDELYYAIQDWARGLTGEKDVRSFIYTMEKRIYERISSRTLLLPYISSDKKVHKRKYTTATNLILIMDYLRNLPNRPILAETRRLFAKRLAYKPIISYKPAKTFFEYDFDQLDLDIEDWVSDDFLYYRMTQEEFLYYDRYFRERFYRRHILDNFFGITKDQIKPEYYDLITNDIYKGLWKRSPATLKFQMGATSLHSVRMLMPRLGLKLLPQW
jgi:hypothetical protein